MPVLSGKAYWAAISNPNTTFEPVWSIDLALDAKAKKEAIDLGLTVKNKSDDRGDFVTIKRKVKVLIYRQFKLPILLSTQKEKTLMSSLMGISHQKKLMKSHSK